MRQISYIFKRLMTFIFHPSTLIYYSNFKGTVIYPNVIIKNASKIRIINSQLSRNCAVKCFITPSCRDKLYIIIENSYFGDRCYISSGGGITIKNVNAAPNVFIGSYIHDMSPVSHSKSNDSNYVIAIEEKTFIGQNVSIVGNINIGKGCIIGAASVVTKDIPDFSMVVGNPSRVIKKFNFEKNLWERI